MTDNGLEAIATLSKLEKLIINYLNQITDNGLRSICGLKELECRKCIYITDESMLTFIKASPCLQLLDISGCYDITNLTLNAAKEACNTRTDNIMLKMIIGGTSVFPTKEDEVQPSPLLQIVNVDLCDDDTSTLRSTDADILDADIYLFDNQSWFDDDSDFDYSSEVDDYDVVEF